MKETYLSRDFRETAAQCFPSQAKELNAFFDARLNVLLAENADASKEKQYHLKRQILPGIAAYETLQRVMPKEEALQTVHGYVEELARTSHKQLAALLHIPGLYRLVPGVFVKSTRSVFGPAAGFDSKELQVGNGIWRVDMMKCPYHDTCVAYGCPELCCCFCDSDDISYTGLHPKLIWHRTKTLGRGDDRAVHPHRVDGHGRGGHDHAHLGGHRQGHADGVSASQHQADNKQNFRRLQQIYRLLKLYGAEDHITFDLSMSGSYGYYTGIIFRAYTYGTGDAVVRGGRYDHLLAKFGKDTPSIGFAIILDELMNALNRQKISVDTVHQNLIVYTEETEKRAIALACNFREKGRNIELIKRETEEERDIFEAYARRTGASALLYLRDDEKIEMVNLKTGEEKIADI